MISVVKTNGLCMNCVRPGHYVKDCTSSHRCKRCQKAYHTLLHLEAPSSAQEPPPALPTSVSNHAATGMQSHLLLMMCRVLVEAPNGYTTESRALLDCGSSASFVSESLAQRLSLPRSSLNARISGVAGLTSNSVARSITRLKISSVQYNSRKFDITAVIVPRVTCNLPLHSLPP